MIDYARTPMNADEKSLRAVLRDELDRADLVARLRDWARRFDQPGWAHDCGDASDAIEALVKERDALRAACEHAIRYDAEIQRCANSPDAMSSHCTAEGESLDDLYAAWISAARAALTVGKDVPFPLII